MKKFIAASFGLVDLLACAFTFLFFCGSAIFNDGSFWLSLIASGAVAALMFMIGLTIEIVVELLSDVRGIGTITGFLTNGPEALVLIVGLIADDILFAASTPLGSNFMNPILLLTASLVVGKIREVLKVSPSYTIPTICLTATLALSFFSVSIFAISELFYLLWIGVAVVATVILFRLRPAEDEPDGASLQVSGKWLVPTLLVMTCTGYYLDPIVNFASSASNAPKGVIGFFVLSTLTSWPEFKSTFSLLKRDRLVSAILNIVVSNITNLWLATAGLITYLLIKM